LAPSHNAENPLMKPPLAIVSKSDANFPTKLYSSDPYQAAVTLSMVDCLADSTFIA
jgi:hypothetical protein